VGNVSTMERPVLVVTGTLREAAVLAKAGVDVIAAGSDPETLAQRLATRAHDVAGLVSFGMCGGIDPALRIGQWVIGRRLTGAVEAACDEAWVRILAERLPDARLGAFHADGRLFSDSADKGERAWGSAALAVDMESHLVAQAAQAAGVPFAIVRCVSDGADEELPPAVEVMMRANGGVDTGAVLRSVWRKPGQLPHLLGTLTGFARAYVALGTGARAMGHRLGFDDRLLAARRRR
jgi:adenosylhomocysteine nucleosidase